MRSVSKLILSALVVLAVAQVGHAGPLRNLFGGGRCRGGGCGQTVTQAQTAAPVVVQTSYSGAGVPVDATSYTPIQVGSPLPTSPCAGGQCQPRPAVGVIRGLFR